MIGVESNLFSNNIIDQGRHAAAAPHSASLAQLSAWLCPAPLYCTLYGRAQSGATLHTMNVLTSTGAANGGGALYVSYFLHVGFL